MANLVFKYHTMLAALGAPFDFSDPAVDKAVLETVQCGRHADYAHALVDLRAEEPLEDKISKLLTRGLYLLGVRQQKGE